MTKWPYTTYSEISPEALRYFPFKSPRTNQLEAVSEILEAINQGYKYIILEAGTGTGKSAIAATLARIFDSSYILTITKQLQDQYAKDFADFQVVKGRSNFRCRLSDVGCDEGKCVLESHRCKYRISHEEVIEENTCRYLYQKHMALESDVVIANYPYMFLELNYVEDFKKRPLMICDEAHNIESMIMSQLTLEFNRRDLKEYVGINLSKTRVSQLAHGGHDVWIDFIEKVKARYDEELEKIRHLETNPEVSRKILFMKNQISDCSRFIEQFTLSPGEWIFDYDRLTGTAQFKPLKIDNYAVDTLFKYCDTCLFMSATILDYELFAEWLGIPVGDIYPIRCKSPFDISKNPIRTFRDFNMTYGNLAKSAPMTVPAIESILKRHSDEKGIIHTISNQCRDFLMDNLKSSRLLTHDTDNRSEVLDSFKQSDNPLVLVSPSMNEGVDLPGDECRFQIIYKIPYPDLADKQTLLRAQDNDRWLDYRTCLALVQTHGRGMRFSEDYCTTYMIDNRFMGYVYSDMISNQFLPDTFRDAIDKMARPKKVNNRIDDGIIGKGEEYISTGDYANAIVYFKKLLGKNDCRIYLNLAKAYELASLYEEETEIIIRFFKSGTDCGDAQLHDFRQKLKKLDKLGYFDYNSNMEQLEKEFFKNSLMKNSLSVF